MNNTLTYYTGANSCTGYISYLPECIEKLDKVVVLVSAPASFKADLFRRAIEGYDGCAEVLMSAGSSEDMDGVILPRSKIAVIGGTRPFSVSSHSTIPGIEVDLSQCIKIEKLHDYSHKISSLKNDEAEKKNNMFFCLRRAKRIHDEWEKIYISHMNFDKAMNEAKRIADELLGDRHEEKTPVNSNRFFGSMTPSGTVNFIDNLTEGFEKRIFIKGRPGTGKSTILKKIRSEAQSRGFDTESYYCSFDANSLDMVIIRELSVCVFDATPPHEMFPNRPGDVISDIYQLAVERGTDEKNKAIIEKIQSEYKSEMQRAKKFLTISEGNKAELDRIFMNISDQSELKVILNKIIG